MLKQGCLVGLSSWIASTAIYWYFLHTRLPSPADWNVSIAAGFVMMVAIGQFRTARRWSGQAQAVARQSTFSGAPGESLKDGEAVTISGRIRAVGPVLSTPFTARPAVIYMYDIKHVRTVGRDVSLVEDYSGYALTPSVIDFAQGTVRLLGFPLLEDFPTERVESETGKKNAAAWVATTKFTDMTDFHPKLIYSEVKHLLTDEMGEIRKDNRISESTDLTQSRLFEQMVAPGEPVCVTGRYSAEKGGLVPDVGGGNVLTLMRGDATTAAASLRRSTAVSVIVGLAIAAIGNAGVYEYVQTFGSRSPVAMVRAATREPLEPILLHRAVQSSDRAEMGRLVQAGLSVDSRDDDGRTPLAMAPDEMTAQWLIAHGADVNAATKDGQTPLMEQASAGNTAIVKLLIASGAKLDLVNSKYKMTALAQARDAEKPQVVDILLGAGAHDTEVTEKNGKPAAADSTPVKVCLDYLDALQREDRAACARLKPSTSEHPDFASVKMSHPVTGHLAGGFLNDDAATISIRGKAPDGTYVTLTFQLAREAGEWKIISERWETRLNSKEQ